ncbi:hypothetical protein ACP70R_043388 [Stipagrostis hirtigluma subsp. patula]
MTDILKSGVGELVMQLSNCISFLLGLAILSATLGPFVTVAHRELLAVTGGKKGLEIKLELSVDKTSTDEEVRSNVLTGRKVDLGDAVMDKDAKNSRSKTSSGAKYSFGKCGHGGRKDLSMNCYVRSRKPPPEVHFDGHIPFTADYRSPRKHPPKNN